MTNYPPQKVFLGSGCAAHLKSVLSGAGCRKFLLVAGKSYDSLPLKADIDAQGLSCVLFRDFSPNPSYEDVCAGVELFQHEECDAVVAIGGGSAMDTAKCIKLFCRMKKNVPYIKQEYADTGIPLIAFPTTAGSGSEATRYAVIYWRGEKQSVTHNSIIPDYVFLEPGVLRSLPLYQKKCTMLDALCQGIESWWSVNSTDESKELSATAVKLVLQNYRSYLSDNARAAEQIMLASNKAGQAINITQTTAAHAMSYKLTSMYGLPHGRAVAVCLPFLWEYMINHPEKCVDSRGAIYVQKIFEEIAVIFSSDEPLLAVSKFRELLKELEIDCSVTEQAGDLDLLAASVNPVRLKNNPIALSEAELRQLYKNILTCKL